MLYYILKWINFELRNICDLFEYVKKISIVSLHIFFLVYWPKKKFCLIKLQYFNPNLISLNILSNLLSNNLIQGGITGEDIESKEQYIYINFSLLLHKTKLKLISLIKFISDGCKCFSTCATLSCKYLP